MFYYLLFPLRGRGSVVLAANADPHPVALHLHLGEVVLVGDSGQRTYLRQAVRLAFLF